MRVVHIMKTLECIALRGLRCVGKGGCIRYPAEASDGLDKTRSQEITIRGVHFAGILVRWANVAVEEEEIVPRPPRLSVHTVSKVKRRAKEWADFWAVGDPRPMDNETAFAKRIELSGKHKERRLKRTALVSFQGLRGNHAG